MLRSKNWTIRKKEKYYYAPIYSPIAITIVSWEIIVYSRSTINTYFLFSHKWWVPLIKFTVEPTIYVKGGSTYLWYSGST